MLTLSTIHESAIHSSRQVIAAIRDGIGRLTDELRDAEAAGDAGVIARLDQQIAGHRSAVNQHRMRIRESVRRLREIRQSGNDPSFGANQEGI